VKKFLDYLAENGGSFEGRDTGLHKAAAKGFSEIVQMLLDAGDPIDRQNEQGLTAFHVAISHAQHKIAEQLLNMHASVDARIGRAEDLRWTSLHWASSNGCNECVDMLLKFKCTVNLKDNNRHTPFDLAVGKNHTAVMSRLKEVGGDL